MCWFHKLSLSFLAIFVVLMYIIIYYCFTTVDNTPVMCSVHACMFHGLLPLLYCNVHSYLIILHAPEKAATAKTEAAQESVHSPQASSATHCTGANYFKEGEDPVLKADEEYPKWLWGLLDKKEGKESKKELRRESKRKIRQQNFERAQSSR